MEPFDITEFARMFDAALASDNPAVQKALRNFMMIAAIVHAQEVDASERTTGPLETLVREVDDLKRMVYELQTTRVVKDYNSGIPTWVYNPNTSISTTSRNDSYSSSYYGTEVDSVADLYSLMKDLKIK